MSLYAKLQKLQEDGKPVRVGMVGAGKFGSMFLAQVRKIPGVQVIAIADLSPERARSNLEFIGWDSNALHAISAEDAQELAGILSLRITPALSAVPLLT